MRSIVRPFVFATCIVASYTGSASGQTPPARRPPPPNGAFPRVSPDGKHVLFTRAVENQPSPFTMDADGSNPRALGTSNLAPGAWLPDGKGFLAMQRTSRTAPGRLIIASIDGAGVAVVDGRGDSRLARPLRAGLVPIADGGIGA